MGYIYLGITCYGYSGGVGGSPVLQLQSVTNWGGAKKLVLQSVTKGGVTALSEGYVIYGRSLKKKTKAFYLLRRTSKGFMYLISYFSIFGYISQKMKKK